MEPVYVKKKSVPALDPVKTGSRVRKHRKSCGVSIEQVSEQTELSVSYLYMLEQGRRRWTKKMFDRMVEAVDHVAGQNRR